MEYNSDNNIVYGNTFSEVYRDALDIIYNEYSYESSPRGLKVRECLNLQMIITDPYQNLFENSYRGIPLKYLKDELLLYFSGRNDAAGFVKASKFWDKIKTKDNLINSAYGYLIFTLNNELSGISQWEWAKNSLLIDSDSRQAILHFNRPWHQYEGNKDFVCTMYGIFHIRNNKLNFSIFMRSQDIRKGTQFDIPFFTLLQQIMLNELKKDEKYKDLEIGTYTHFCNSFHLYEPDFEIAENMLNAEWKTSSIPRININPILHQNIINASYGFAFNKDGSENDEFFNWLRS